MDPLPPVQLMPAKRIAMTQEEFDTKFEFVKNRQLLKRGSISTLDLSRNRINFSKIFKCCFNMNCEEGTEYVRTSVVGVINHGKDVGVLSEVGSGVISNKSLTIQNGQRGEKNLSYIIGKFIPLIDVLSQYSIKKTLLQDFIGSVIVTSHAIGEGLSLSFLGGISPICGLYSCFISFLMNSLFAKNNCEGFGINIIIMFIINQIIGKLRNSDIIVEDNDNFNMEIMTTITLMIVVNLLIILLLNLQFLIEYLPKHLISGILFGLIIKIFLSQSYTLIQLPMEMPIKNITIICLNSTSDCSKIFNIYTISISLSCLLFIFVIKRINDNIVKPLVSFRISISLLLIIFIAFLSRKIEINSNYAVDVFNHFSLPFKITLPKIYLVPYLLFDSIILSILSISIYQKFSEKNCTNFKDEVKYNIFIISIINTISSFFNGTPVSYFNENSIRVSRTKYIRTPLTFLLSSLLLIPFILFSDVIFSKLPLCVLSCFIITSSIDYLYDISKISLLWNTFRCDFFIWISSLILIIFFHDICLSIFIASMTSVIFSIVRKIQISNINILVNVTGSGVYYGEKNRYDADFFDYDNGIAVARFESPLLYNNSILFKKSMISIGEKIKGNIQPYGIGTRTPSMKSTCAAGAIQSQRDTLCIRSTLLISGDVVPTFEFLNMDKNELSKVLIIDCSGITSIDSIGVDAIVEVYKNLLDKGVKVYFSNMSANNRDLLQACNVFHAISKSAFFPSIHDAVLHAHQISGNGNSNIYMSASMHGCRDLITLSTAPSNQNISDEQPKQDSIIFSGRESSLASLTPRPSLPDQRLTLKDINKDSVPQVLRATISNG
uniref:STAS domain-containing protein n=1 Tax=Parastrongyloides trichosuri TaxID=131310 RepID=A0A0N5A2F5_PARTI